MKILVISWRAWSAGHRYRAFMINAKKAGHQILGIASHHISDSALSMAAFAEIGIPATRNISEINRFEPDAIFGEYFWLVQEERAAQIWAAQHNKPGFLLDHRQFQNSRITWPGFARSALLVVNQVVIPRAKEGGFPVIHVVGLPDLDLIAESYDIPALRTKFGAKPGQPLVALFLEHISGTGSPRGRSLEHDQKNMFHLADMARKRGWKVVAHCHGQERQSVSSLYFPSRIELLRGLQQRGVTFIVGFVPSTVGGVKFHRGCPYELIAAADASTGSTGSLIPKAYALGKRYFSFYGPWIGSGPTRIASSAGRGMQNFPNFSTVGSQWRTLIDAAENNKGSIELDPVFVEEQFHKLDRQCWKRMLELAAAG